MSERQRTAISITALVVAVLGWTPIGEAAKNAVFPPNSVGTAQLKRNAVTGPKIRNGAVTGLDIQKRTLLNTHIKPGSLLSSSFKPGQIPAGPKGDRGDKGDKGDTGAPGLSGLEIVISVTGGGAISPKVGTSHCPAGKKIVGGGAMANGPTGLVLTQSGPIANTHWTARAEEVVAVSANWNLSVYAI